MSSVVSADDVKFENAKLADAVQETIADAVATNGFEPLFIL